MVLCGPLMHFVAEKFGMGERAEGSRHLGTSQQSEAEAHIHSPRPNNTESPKKSSGRVSRNSTSSSRPANFGHSASLRDSQLRQLNKETKDRKSKRLSIGLNGGPVGSDLTRSRSEEDSTIYKHLQACLTAAERQNVSSEGEESLQVSSSSNRRTCLRKALDSTACRIPLK